MNNKPLNIFNKTGEWEKEAERRHPPVGWNESQGVRSGMIHEFLAGCQFAHSLDRQKAEQIWEAAERYGRDQEYVLKPEGQIYPDKEAFLNEMFKK